jgi:phage tail tape-measure protein
VLGTVLTFTSSAADEWNGDAGDSTAARVTRTAVKATATTGVAAAGGYYGAIAGAAVGGAIGAAVPIPGVDVATAAVVGAGGAAVGGYVGGKIGDGINNVIDGSWNPW